MLPKWIVAWIISACLLTGCSERAGFYQQAEKLDPFARVEYGMSEAQVVAILGKPTKRSELVHETLPGGKVIKLIWVHDHTNIQATFVGGKLDQKVKK